MVKQTLVPSTALAALAIAMQSHSDIASLESEPYPMLVEAVEEVLSFVKDPISIDHHESQIFPLTLNNTDAAKLLGVSPQMLRLSRHTGELFKGQPAPVYSKFGPRHVRYKRDYLIAYVSGWQNFQSHADVLATKSIK